MSEPTTLLLLGSALCATVAIHRRAKMGNNPTRLPIHCPTCGKPVTLHYTPSDAPDTRHWECPHCQPPNGI
jgi:ribosomal protein L37AE/L43A